MYYQTPKEPGGCGEVWVLTRAVFAILFWPLVALALIMGWLFVTLYAFFQSPPLALVPLAVGILAIVLFARWERSRGRPSGP